MTSYHQAQAMIMTELAEAMAAVDEVSVRALAGEIDAADRVFFIGTGRVFLALQAMAKRLAHLGVATVVVGQITEPAIRPGDLLIAGSGSGESLVPVVIARKAKTAGARLAHIGTRSDSSIGLLADIFVRLPVPSKLAAPRQVSSSQPMTSLFEQCLWFLGDAIALMLIDSHGLDLADLWQHHANLE
ncbi:MAG: SIS domain-containing protein [Bifidobacteriaceae bacterium]|jgi:6-phospho-3-hexuloisomerase|nr:SIS domain-containing protein [Bifidobacteriaceae bacterium]